MQGRGMWEKFIWDPGVWGWEQLLCDPEQLVALSGPQFLHWYNGGLDWILFKLSSYAQSPSSKGPVKSGALGSGRAGFESSLLLCSVTLGRWFHVSEPIVSSGDEKSPFVKWGSWEHLFVGTIREGTRHTVGT